MKTIDIKLLMRKKHELLTKHQGILDLAVEEERGYSDDERAEIKKLQDQIAALDEHRGTGAEGTWCLLSAGGAAGATGGPACDA